MLVNCIYYGMKKSLVISIVCVGLSFVLAVSLCIGALNSPVFVSSTGNPLKIVIDAGHGGIDGGVVGITTGAKESDINLAISLKLYDKLNYNGFSVSLTRKTEEGLYGVAGKGFKKRDMAKRKEIILAEKPALVLSIHQNRYPLKSVRGAQVFYLAENSESKALAECLQNNLNALYQEEGVKPRIAKAGEYFILACSPYPSVIIECGFLSSEQDETLLLNPAWQKRLIESVSAGVFAYLSRNAL